MPIATPSRDALVDYYNQTHLGYRLFWGLDRAFSMHYGLHDANHRSHASAVVNLIRYLAGVARITGADEVLDVGCGFGGSSVWLAKNIGCKVTGIDINPKELAVAREHARESGVAHLVRFEEMDYRDMDRLGEGAYGVVWQVETLIYADRMRFLADAFDRLRRGGRLVVADYFSRDGAVSAEEKAVLDRWVRSWAGTEEGLISGNDFTDTMKKVGFADVLYLDKSASVLRSSRRMSRVCRVTAPLGRALEVVGLRSRLQTENSVGAVLQYDALKRGSWSYGVACGKKP
jgi:cyclopropane fatty-acyl-phospholipid synthase-like methyltransferase